MNRSLAGFLLFLAVLGVAASIGIWYLGPNLVSLAFDEERRNAPYYVLSFAAGDPGAEAIRMQAADLENVVFLGDLSQPELAAILQTADVSVLPSFFEGLPLVVIESLACGCRVVMTDLPGLDSWMPDGLCDEGLVERVRLPRLIGPDTPMPEDLPRFVEELVEALNRQLARSVACGRASGADCRLAPMSWAGVFGRIRAAYQELAE